MKIFEDRIEISTGIRDFKKDVLHHIAAVWTLEDELVPFEKNVIKAPDGA